MSEHSCSSPGGHPIDRVLLHTESSQWGLGGDTVYMGKGGRGVVVVKIGEQEEGTIFYKASNGTTPMVETQV